MFSKVQTKLNNGVLLTGIPDNESLNLVIRYPDDFYPEIIQNFVYQFFV